MTSRPASSDVTLSSYVVRRSSRDWFWVPPQITQTVGLMTDGRNLSDWSKN